jgi:AcrR family transcriptional regulator
LVIIGFVARPIDADAAATRRRILEQAGALFAEEGQQKGSIREIARRSGVSLAMIHHYFGSKDELYASCVDAMYAELATLTPELMGSFRASDEPGEAIREAMRALFRFACAHRPAVRLMLRTVVETGELDRERRERVLLPFLAEGSEALAERLGRPPGELRLPLQSLVFLTARYAIASEQELALVAASRTAVGARAAVEDHLVQVATQMLGMPAAERPERKSRR